MAKQIIWSLQAQNDRKEILTYWFVRNKSNTDGKKLNLLIRKAIKLISLYPYIGFKTDVENVRAKVLRDYLIIYQVS
jgi:plasmid stabilization system protein ParE